MLGKSANFIRFFLAVALLACSENGDSDRDSGSEVIDESQLFEPDHLLQIAIEMESGDWDRLRNEGRPLAETLANCGDPDFDYIFYHADVTIDDITVKNVGVRKKGYLGSISTVRPSFRIDFSEFEHGQKFAGMKRMTLNNNRQDPSNTHQCMSYALFREAGVVAPRCNFAHVTLNGRDLGIYSHVESIKKPFLARHFEDNGGNLYEVQRADFSDAAIPYFEKKTNKDNDDRSDLKKVVEALEAADDNLYESLDRVVDLDAFLTYWAMEVIVGHWDSATGNSNNHYIYHDPTTDKFYFIPWGTDGTFEKGQLFLKLAGLTVPDSVYAMARIPYRLYNHIATRRLYHERLKQLLDKVWDEEALLNEVDRIDALTSADPEAIAKQRAFIRERRESIEEELTDDGPEWPLPPELYPSMKARTCVPPTKVSGRFVTTWGELRDYATNTENQLDLSIDGQTVETADVMSSAGLSFDPIGVIGVPELWVIGIPAETYPPAYMVTINFNTASLFEEGEILFHGFETSGAVIESYSENDDDYRILGFVGDGSITLDEAGTDTADPVEGAFEGYFVRVY